MSYYKSFVAMTTQHLMNKYLVVFKNGYLVGKNYILQ